MNVFYTDQDPIIAASHHNYVHQVKMIVEYAQLLSAAHHVIDGDDAIDGIYKLSHKNHPSAVWVRKSSHHYNWVLDCALELCWLYSMRTGKVHKTYNTLVTLKQLPKWIADTPFTEPPVAAPDEFKAIAVFEGACVAYQRYLVAKFDEWRTRIKPIKVEFDETPYWA